MQLHKIWIEQCEAARGIENEFGTQKALAYLVGEKFLNYLGEPPKRTPTSGPNFLRSLPKSKQFSSLGNCRSILKRPAGRSHSIPTFTSRKMKPRSSSRWSDRTTCGVWPTKSC
jgi:hypothetical protein